jgi:hypothetical protein
MLVREGLGLGMVAFAIALPLSALLVDLFVRYVVPGDARPLFEDARTVDWWVLLWAGVLSAAASIAAAVDSGPADGPARIPRRSVSPGRRRGRASSTRAQIVRRAAVRRSPRRS